MDGLTDAGIAMLRDPLRVITEPAWIVGGGLRDAILGRDVLDVDVALDGDAAAVSGRLAAHHRAGRFRLSAAFDAWRVKGGTLPFRVDITPLQGGSLAEDLARRDFTVNALALPVSAGGLRDDVGGLGDLASRRLRMVRPGELLSDPARVLRAARQAVELDATLDPVVVSAGRAAAPMLDRVAGERIAAELARIVAGPSAAAAVAHLHTLGALAELTPTASAPDHRVALIRSLDGPAWSGLGADVAAFRSAAVADGVTGQGALMMAAILDRSAASAVEAFCDRLHTANRLRALLVALAPDGDGGASLLTGGASAAQVARSIAAAGPAGIGRLALDVARALERIPAGRIPMLVADVLAAHGELRRRARQPPPLTAADVIALVGKPPGRWLGETLAALRHAQLVGEVSGRDEAIQFVRTLQSLPQNRSI
ncbi:MAG: CCA tRNA nucleotidyltransferase [Actinobacteria bacterium]|nr:CCA tRNA nucleotidyltransferase [Actinomycetota bacterium]